MMETEIGKVLIVDDMEDNLRVVSAILGEHKLAISVARNGKDAIRSVNKKPPDLILLDITMPDMDGYEVCSILKSDPQTKDIPIIFLTALTQTENLVRGFDIGAADYVTKPFNKKELLARVLAHIQLKKNRDLIREKNKILAEQNEAIEKQKSRIESQHMQILSSVRYAQRIQTAILPENNFLDNYFNEHFIIYKPKDQLSGDFYWTSFIDNQILIAVADCTGHGVPGAFMSILGLSFLREILQRGFVTNPAIILRRLRKRIISALKQTGEEGEQKDGMDIALVSINIETKLMHYAGAYSPLYIVRNPENKSKSEIKILELKADKMPIGIYEKMDRFTNQEFQLETGDQIYLFTDGIVDQFGGPKTKRYLSHNLRKLISDIASEKFSLQKQLINNTIDNWMHGYDVKCNQTDDITLIGVKI